MLDSRYLVATASLVAILAVACDSNTSPDPDPGPGAPDPEVISPAGSTLEVVSEDGVALTLRFPAGAVDAETTISVERVDAETPRYAITPSDLVLREPVEIELTVPDLPSDPVVWLEAPDASRVGLAVEVDGTTIRTETRTLAFAPLADARLAEETTTFLDVTEMDCTLAAQSLQQRIAQVGAWFSSGGHESLAGEPLSALLQDLALLTAQCGGDYDAERELLAEMSCTRYEEAVTNMKVVLPPDDPEGLSALLLPIEACEALRQATGGNCEGSISFAEASTIGYDKYLEHLLIRVESPGWLEGQPWDAVWSEVTTSVHTLLYGAWKWGVETAADRITGELLPTQYARLHRGAYRGCQEDNDQSYLADLATAGAVRGHQFDPEPSLPSWAPMTQDAIHADIALCGAELVVEIFDAVADPVSSLSLGGGPAPGEATTEATVLVPADGFVDLTGPVRALFCVDPTGPVSFADDELVVSINGNPVQALPASSSGAFLETPYDLSMEETFDLVGLPGNPGDTFVLTLDRVGTACGGGYGPDIYELFALTFEVDGECDPALRGEDECPELEVFLDLPDSIHPDASEEVEIAAALIYPGWEDRIGGDEEGYEPAENATFVVETEGGAASPSSGTLDAWGEAEFSITLDPGSPAVLLSVTVTTEDELYTKTVTGAVSAEASTGVIIRPEGRFWMNALTGSTEHPYISRYAEGSAVSWWNTLEREADGTIGTVFISNMVSTTYTSLNTYTVRGSLATMGTLEGFGDEVPVLPRSDAQIQLTLMVEIPEGTHRIDMTGTSAHDVDAVAQAGALFTSSVHMIEPDGTSYSGDEMTSFNGSWVLGPGEHELVYFGSQISGWCWFYGKLTPGNYGGSVWFEAEFEITEQ